MQCFAVDISQWDPQPELLERLLTLLDDRTLEARIRRYKFRQDALRSLVGKLLPRWYLVSHAKRSMTWEDLREGRTETGRPYMITKSLDTAVPRFDYNVSHDGDLVVMACIDTSTLPRDLEEVRLGVDIMQLCLPKGFTSEAELAETVADLLAPRERSQVAANVEGPKRLRVLLRYWTAKEAVSKAFGLGLSYPMAELDVTDVAHCDELSFITRERHCSIRLSQLEASGEAYVLATATVTATAAGSDAQRRQSVTTLHASDLVKSIGELAKPGMHHDSCTSLSGNAEDEIPGAS